MLLLLMQERLRLLIQQKSNAEPGFIPEQLELRGTSQINSLHTVAVAEDK